MELLRQAVRRAEAGESLALVTVIRVGGSTPRHVGTKMLVDAAGRIYDTIGGGKVEMEVTSAAMEVAQGGAARIVRRQLVRDLAMCCGGAMECYVEPVASSIEALRTAIELWDARVPTLLVTPLDGRPKFVERISTPEIPGYSCTEERFIEPVRPRDRIILFGAGHVARALGPVAASVKFEIIVCDDDETGALTHVSGAPWVTKTVESFDVRDVEADLGPLGTGDYAVIMTRDHGIDQEVLEQLLPKESLAYLGLIGSEGKIGRFHKRLTAKGVATEARWSRLHAPIGLDIGAETPDEIAVAVVAELVRVRRLGPVKGPGQGATQK